MPRPFALGDDKAAHADHRETLLHEAFHGYQRDAFADRGRNEFLDPNFLDETSHRAMLALQFALAQQAHSSRDLEDIRAWLSVRVALNEVIAPRKSLTILAISSEPREPLIGSVSDQVSQKIIATAWMIFSSKISPLILKLPMPVRTSAYITGALFIDLVNDYSAENTDWRQTIEQGATPFELAVQTFAISTEDASGQHQ